MSDVARHADVAERNASWRAVLADFDLRQGYAGLQSEKNTPAATLAALSRHYHLPASSVAGSRVPVTILPGADSARSVSRTSECITVDTRPGQVWYSW